MFNKLYKSMLAAGTAALFSTALFSVPVLAGEWRANSNGFWYVNDDGTYPTSAWQWIDSDGDGVYQCFAFDEQGYLMLNQTTPDGYLVGAGGAWFDGTTPVTRTYAPGTYVAPTPIQASAASGYASDGTKLVTQRTGTKTTTNKTSSKSSSKTSSSSSKSSSSKTSSSSSSSSKTSSSSSGSSSSASTKTTSQTTNTNVGNTASVAKKDLVSGRITIKKETVEDGSTTTSTNTSDRTDPSTTAASKSTNGPSVPKSAGTSTSHPQTYIDSSSAAGPQKTSSTVERSGSED